MSAPDRNALAFVQERLDVIKSRAVDFTMPLIDADERDDFAMEILRAVRSLELELIHCVIEFKPLPEQEKGAVIQ